MKHIFKKVVQNYKIDSERMGLGMVIQEIEIFIQELERERDEKFITEI